MKIILPLLISLLSFVSLMSQELCTSEFLFNTDHENPLGLATDDSFFWVSGRTILDGGIDIHDESGNLIKTIYIDDDESIVVGGLALQEDTLWAVQEQEGLLYKLDKTTGEKYSEYYLPTFDDSDPNNWGIAFDGEHLWNVEYGFEEDSFIYKMNPTNGKVLDTVRVELELLLPIEIINGNMIGVTLDSSKLYEINLESGDINYLVDWCLDVPFDIAFNSKNELFGISGSLEEGTQSVNRIEDFGILTSIIEQPKSIINELVISPNPAISSFRIDSSNIKEGQVTIIDIHGQTWKTDHFRNYQYESDISELKSGIYCVILEGERARSSKTFYKIN